MNIVKLQNIKFIPRNPLLSSTNTMKTQKEKLLWNSPIPHCSKKNKIPRNRQKACMQETIRHWWKKSKMTQTDGEIHHVLGLVFFTELEQKNSQFVWKHKRPRTTKAVLRKKKELDVKWTLDCDVEGQDRKRTGPGRMLASTSHCRCGWGSFLCLPVCRL